MTKQLQSTCGSKAPVVRHPSVTEGRVSRRAFLKLVAGVTAGVSGGVFLGSAAGHAMYGRQKPQSAGETRYQLWERLREGGEAPDPMQVRLAVVALNAAGIDPAKSQDDIRSEVADQTGRISNTTFGQFTFDISYHVEDEQPDSTGERDGQVVPLYPREQMMNIARRYGELGYASMVLLMVNSADTKDEYYLGLAVEDETMPTAIVRSRITGGNAIGHEIGHLLNPYVIGPGMHHEQKINTCLRDENGQIRQVCAFGTIQQLITEGACELQKKRASWHTIMGSSDSFPDDSRPGETVSRPVYSSAEQLFLNPLLRSTVTNRPGYYEISNKPGGNFGVRIELPKDHILQQLVPNAEELFFGPDEGERLFENGTENPASIRSIGAFVTYDGGRGTTLLDIGPGGVYFYPDLNKPVKGVIYADEQLDIIVVAGCGEGQAYLQLLQLSTPQGRSLLEEAQRYADKTNKELMPGNE